MSNSTKRNAEELRGSLRLEQHHLENMSAFTRLHIKDAELVAKMESCVKTVKDTIQFIDDKLKG